jgi:hypothetical protein
MLAALALAAVVADWTPARWFSADPASLELVQGSSINCLLLEQSYWKPEILRAAADRNLAMLAVARSEESAMRALPLPFKGIVLEGGLDDPALRRIRDLAGDKPVITLGARRDIRFDSQDPLLGTTQGVWPGLEIEHSGPKTSAPTGSAWIHTNTGFLRFVRAATSAAFWMANRPPEGTEWGETRYMQAIADAAQSGARWAIALDSRFQKRLLAREPAALASWKRIVLQSNFYADNRGWRRWQTRSQLSLLQDTDSGALITGNLLDMLAVMNTPVRAVPSRRLNASQIDGARVVVAIHPQAYTPEQKALIARFAAGGGKVVSGPDSWRMPAPDRDGITFDKKHYKLLEAIWPELHLAIQRKNFGARLFNVTGTLSFLLQSPDGGKALLHLVNYTDYPVEAITAFVQGKYRKATLLTAESAPRALSLYDAPEGTAVEVDKLGVSGAILLE